MHWHVHRAGLVRWIPNGLSIIRLICAPVIAGLILMGNSHIALYWVVLAFCTDFLDGWIARKYQCESNVGRFLDPLADKMLSFCLFSALCVCQKIPMLLCLVVVLRDVCIGIGVWWMRHERGIVHFQPAGISKINTVVQGLLAVSLLWEKGVPYVDTLIAVLWATTLLSFIIYCKILMQYR